MEINRRQFLNLGAMGLTALALSSCALPKSDVLRLLKAETPTEFKGTEEKDQTIPADVLRFPDGFKFGAATSGLQTEKYYGADAVRSDWGHFFTEDRLGRGPILKPNEKTADWFHDKNAERDFEFVSKLGLQMFRLGIEWARCFPDEENKVDMKAVRRYREWINDLQKRGITPMVTMNHFSIPEWMAKQGGWESSRMVKAFKRYAETIADNFGDVPYWISINEPEGVAGMGYLYGEWPPQKTSAKSALFALSHIKKANGVVFNEIKKRNALAQVGTTNNINWFEPNNPESQKDRLVTAYARYLFNDYPIGLTTDQTDFTGMDFYTGYRLKFAASLESGVYDNSLAIRAIPGAQTVIKDELQSDMGWPIVPQYFYAALKHIYETFKKPIIITENGIADSGDNYRAFYILSHLIALHQAMQAGVDVRGYNYWSIMDNIELAKGTQYRFGLAALDPETGERTLRQSAGLYQEIVRSNEIDVDSLSRRFLTSEQRERIKHLIF